MVERATAVIKPLDSADRRTYGWVIYETLHELIQELVLPPGERLVEADLAARFSVSKTPIREALRLLATEGLVTIVPHSGATVTWLSLHDFKQQLFLQDALEQPALPLVVERISVEARESIGGVVEGIRAAHARNDESGYHRLVRQMHAELFALAGYPRLTELIGSVMQSMRRYHPIFVRPFIENWNRDLEIIVRRFERICAGDPAGAAEVVRQGHAATLAYALRRVEARDPAVMPYLVVSPFDTGGNAATVNASAC